MAKNATAAAKLADDTDTGGEMWTVMDTLVTDAKAPRTHTMIVDGAATDYTFQRQQRLSMTPGEARKFLIDAAFDVRDGNNNRVRPLDATEKVTDKAVKLQPGQVVAGYDDLTKEALLRRVSHLIGGERFTAQSTRDDIIAFLTDQTVAVEKQNSVQDRLSDELSDRDLEKLMGPKDV